MKSAIKYDGKPCLTLPHVHVQGLRELMKTIYQPFQPGIFL